MRSLKRNSAMFASVVAAGLLLVNCRRDVSAAENAAPSVGAPGEPAQPNAGNHKAAQQFDEPAFTLTISPLGVCSAGGDCTAQVELKAKGAHHVNQEYPHKLKLNPVAGLSFPKGTLTKEEMSLGEASLSLKVPFRSEQKGVYSLGGEFAFSLCTADRCLIEKRDLLMPVEVR